MWGILFIFQHSLLFNLNRWICLLFVIFFLTTIFWIVLQLQSNFWNEIHVLYHFKFTDSYYRLLPICDKVRGIVGRLSITSWDAGGAACSLNNSGCTANICCMTSCKQWKILRQMCQNVTKVSVCFLRPLCHFQHYFGYIFVVSPHNWLS